MVIVTRAMLGQDATYAQFRGALRYLQMNTPIAVTIPENLIALAEVISYDFIAHRHIKMTCQTDATHQIGSDCPFVCPYFHRYSTEIHPMGKCRNHPVQYAVICSPSSGKYWPNVR
jgi:hypothetical protein